MSSTPRQSESLGRHTALVEEALGRIAEGRVIERIWQRDATVWKPEEPHQKIIRNSLGWLTVPRLMMERIDELDQFSKEVREAGFTHVMLLGMGGSSLCPEVLRRTFGRHEGFPELLVLDTTDPDTIAAFEQRINLRSTLFIVSSKSGTTIEPLSFYKYFFDGVETIKGASAGENFVAVTDPGTLMESTARAANFRRVFLNPADIGGRYSALSYFGMVPAALMGLDTKEMIKRALAAMEECGESVRAADSNAVRLGAVMGALALNERDKLTVVADERVSSLGLWIEQLVAESTGKEGRGIVPVAGEPVSAPDVYNDDRVFVSISVGEASEETESKLLALEQAGHVVVRRRMRDLPDLSSEFFVWEFATAIAGHMMGINPFDQPNVQESKDITNSLLEEFKKEGALPEETPLVSSNELKIYGAGARVEEEASFEQISLSAVVANFLSKVKPGDYVALLAYIEETKAHDEELEAIRIRLRDRFRVATTTGYGPRYLHSTGQLHKGGADNGVFIELTDEDRADLPVPGEPYTFGTLKAAQALGDFKALAAHGRRAIRVHLGKDAGEGLRKLDELLQIISLDALSAPGRRGHGNF